MARVRRSLGAPLLILALAVSARSQTPDSSDTQIWPDVSLNYRVHPDVALHFFGTVRLGRDLADPVTEHLGVGVNYTVNEHLSTFASYRFVLSQPTPDTQSVEHRYFFDVTPRASLSHGLVISDRNRFEFRNINGAFSRRYRNRVQVEREYIVRERRVTPYASFEMFYDDRFHAWTQRRVFGGARVQLSKHLTLDTHFQRLLDDRARLGRVSIIGTLLRLEF
jgi:hypothetical protein